MDCTRPTKFTEPTAPLSFDFFAPDAHTPTLHERSARAHEESAKAEPRHAASRQEPSPACPHLTFADGLYGFGGFHTFVLADLVHALNAVDDPTVQLSVVDAALAVRGYPLAEAQAAAGVIDEAVAVASSSSAPRTAAR